MNSHIARTELPLAAVHLALLAGLGLYALASAAEAAKPVRRLAVVVGHDHGLTSEPPLRYAEGDAGSMAKTLLEIGDVRPHDLYALRGRPAAELWHTLSLVKERAAAISARADVVLLFYYSGHGSRQALHLGGERVALSRLRRTLSAMRARTVVAFFDACAAGAVVRRKGIRRRPRFEIHLSRPPLVRGRVFIASSAEHEASLEADDVGGSYFSHYLVSGLRGDADANKDGRVDLAEAYAYTYHRTVARSAVSRAGTQHPTYDFDLRGAGGVPLTWPSRSDTGLTLGEGLAGSYVIVSRYGQQVAAEIDKRVGRRVFVALPAQSYLIKRRVARGYLVGRVNLTWGGKALLADERSMKRVPYAAVARKGEAGPLPTHALSALAELRTGAVAGGDPLLGGRLGYRWALAERWQLGASAAYYSGGLETDEGLALATHAAALELSGGLRLPWRRIAVHLGAWSAVGLGWQPLPGRPGRRAAMISGGVVGALSWLVAEPLTLQLELRGGVEGVEVDRRGFEARPVLLVGLGPGLAF